MKTNLFIAALSLVVLAGCSGEDEIGTLVAKNDNAINFGTYVGKQTKASIMDDTKLQTTGFNVIATYTGVDTWASLSGDKAKAPNFMYEPLHILIVNGLILLYNIGQMNKMRMEILVK